MTGGVRCPGRRMRPGSSEDTVQVAEALTLVRKQPRAHVLSRSQSRGPARTKVHRVRDTEPELPFCRQLPLSGSTGPLSSQVTVVYVFGSRQAGPLRLARTAAGGNLSLRQRRWGLGAAGTVEVVITTKLFRPSLRQQTVERKRLYDVLRQGRTLPLILVVAPAGWGKSTLVADWLAHDEVPAGWVSLDGGDNDPMRFWRYLLLAADQAGSAAGAAALRRLDAAGSDVLRDVLPVFVNELASAQAPLVLVLDDYHLVTNARVHMSIATLLERSPPQLHLMLITRADPLLPLSRLRVRGELAELRAEDLRFSLGEALEFFSDRLGPLLSEQDVLRPARLPRRRHPGLVDPRQAHPAGRRGPPERHRAFR